MLDDQRVLEEAAASLEQLHALVALPEAIELHGATVGHCEHERIVRGGRPRERARRAQRTHFDDGEREHGRLVVRQKGEVARR